MSLINIPCLDIINYIKNTIDIISTLKVDEILSKYKKGKNANVPEDYEALLVKEEASLRQHIALENKLKLDYETLTERINNLETENNILKKQIKEQKDKYEKKIEEINKEIINLNNMKNDIQKNERKLRKKLDIKEKEIFKLQSKLNSINNNNNNGEYSNSIKNVKNINSNSSFFGKDDTLKEYKKIPNNENISNNINPNEDDSKNKMKNEEIINNEMIPKKGRNLNNNKFATINSNSMHHLNKCNSMSKINYKHNISEKDNLFNEFISRNLDNDTINANHNRNNIFNSILPYNNYNSNKHREKGENLSIIKKAKNDIKTNDKPDNNILINNNNDHKSNTLNHSSNIKDNNENIILENLNNMNNMNTNNSIDTIKIEQKGNNYIKISDSKLLLITQKQNNKLKRTFSAINHHDKNNNNIYEAHQSHQKDKLKLKRDITPDKISNFNQNINNSILKINDNSASRKFYLIKRTPRKNGYKNSMPNIKGINMHKSNNREINQFQFLSNKIGNNSNLNSNYKDNYSQLKFNDYKRISPQNKMFGDANNFNFNNTNIINNKIIQKEGNINNNIIIINGQIVEQNNKDEYPLISINKNNISLKRLNLKNAGTGVHELNKNKK